MLYAIYEGKKWGFVDGKGKVVVEPKYLDVRNDARDLIAVKDPAKKRWGFIDAKGKLVIEPEYDTVNDFSDGLASVMRIRKKVQVWSFIDAKGKTVIENATGSGGFSGEFARVRKDDGTSTWINRKGEPKFEPEALSNFVEGLATARDASSELCGFIDEKGAWAVRPKFEELGTLMEGLALAPDGDRVRFVDRKGKVVVDTKFTCTRKVNGFSEGLAVVRDGKSAMYGYIDAKGKLAIPARFGAASSFKEGLASAGPSSTEQGVIDKKGNYVLEPKYYEIRAFHGGIAKVFPRHDKKDTFGLMDKSGKWVWKPKALR